jgi:hypothetical protein
MISILGCYSITVVKSEDDEFQFGECGQYLEKLLFSSAVFRGLDIDSYFLELGTKNSVFLESSDCHHTGCVVKWVRIIDSVAMSVEYIVKMQFTESRPLD